MHILFGSETEKDSVSSIDSELDLMSSDEAEQSESENAERYKKCAGKLDDIDLLENLVFANLESSVSDKVETQPAFCSGSRTEIQLCAEADLLEEKCDVLPTEEIISQQFLDSLGLEKIECKISTEPSAGNNVPEPILSIISQFDSAKNSSFATDTQYNSSEYIPSISFHSPPFRPDPIYSSLISPHCEVTGYYDGLVSQGGVGEADQTVTMALTSAQSMYGTSLPGRDSPAVMLDPIATFMSGGSGTASDDLSNL